MSEGQGPQLRYVLTYEASSESNAAVQPSDTYSMELSPRALSSSQSLVDRFAAIPSVQSASDDEVSIGFNIDQYLKNASQV